MRVLLITPILPAATGNGLSMRAGMWLEALSRRGEVDLLITPFFPAHESAADFVGRHASTAQLLGGQALGYPGLPRTVPTLDEESTTLLRERIDSADVVVIFRLYLIGLAEYAFARGIPVIADLDDLDWVREERLGQLQEAESYRHYAAATLGLAKVATTASSADAESGHSIHRGPTWLHVPNAVREPIAIETDDDLAVSKSNADGYDLLFVATLGYEPNADAARWLATEVAPLLPEARIAIIGAGPGPDVLALASDRITIAADVPEVTSWYLHSKVCVVPIHSGAGTRTKIPEAWAHGRPVVSTTIGAEGLNVEGAALIADDAQAFADACARLLADTALRERLADRGRELYAAEHSLDHAVELVGEALDRALAGSRAGIGEPRVETVPEVPADQSNPVRNADLEITPSADGFLVRIPGTAKVAWLNRTGYLIFELCTGRNDETAIAAALIDAYGLSRSPIDAVRTAIAELVTAGLVTPGAPEPVIDASLVISVWHGGANINPDAVTRLNELLAQAEHAKVPARLVFDSSRSLRTARNLAASRLLTESDATHLLFLDATLEAIDEVTRVGLARLLRSAHEVIGVPTSIGEPNWKIARMAARGIPDLTEREMEVATRRYDASFLINPDPDIAEDGYLEARHCGSHALMVRRSALERIAGSGQANTNIGYLDHGHVQTADNWGFFDPWRYSDGVDIDEDFAFCERVRHSGARVMVDFSGSFGECVRVGKRLQQYVAEGASEE